MDLRPSTLLHALVLAAIASARLSPTPELLAKFGAWLCRRLSARLVRDHANRLKAGRPRISMPVTGSSEPSLIDIPGMSSDEFGFILQLDGAQIAGEAWLAYAQHLRLEVSWYWSQPTAGSGRTPRKVFAPGLRSYLVTMSPWHWRYLRLRPGTRQWWVDTARALMREFARRTGYRVFACACHLGSGCAHFHVIYSVVWANHTRVDLHNQVGPGRRGTRAMGIARVATLRRARAGLDHSPQALTMRMKVAAESAQRKSEPLDWALSQWLDAQVLAAFPDAPAPEADEFTFSTTAAADDPVRSRIQQLLTVRREIRKAINKHLTKE